MKSGPPRVRGRGYSGRRDPVSQCSSGAENVPRRPGLGEQTSGPKAPRTGLRHLSRVTGSLATRHRKRARACSLPALLLAAGAVRHRRSRHLPLGRARRPRCARSSTTAAPSPVARSSTSLPARASAARGGTPVT